MDITKQVESVCKCLNNELICDATYECVNLLPQVTNSINLSPHRVPYNTTVNSTYIDNMPYLTSISSVNNIENLIISSNYNYCDISSDTKNLKHELENTAMIPEYFDVKQEIEPPSKKTEIMEPNNFIDSTVDEINICEMCGEFFKSNFEFYIHAEGHGERFRSVRNIHKCTLCKDIFPNRSSLLDHSKVVHEEVNSSKIVCSLCGKKCKDKKGLLKHSLVHANGQTLSCELCKKQFYSRPRLKRHMLSHRNKTVICEECGKEIPDSRALANHRASHNVRLIVRNGGKPRVFPCSACNKVFASRSSQQIHVRVHTGERPFACHFCYKAFADGGTLRKHERIHTGEKPYVCPICPKAFNQRVVLREHIRTHHANSSSYTCAVCDKLCSSTRDLCIHLVKHSDDNTAKHRVTSTKPRKHKQKRNFNSVPSPNSSDNGPMDSDDFILSNSSVIDDIRFREIDLDLKTENAKLIYLKISEISDKKSGRLSESNRNTENHIRDMKSVTKDISYINNCSDSVVTDETDFNLDNSNSYFNNFNLDEKSIIKNSPRRKCLSYHVNKTSCNVLCQSNKNTSLNKRKFNSGMNNENLYVRDIYKTQQKSIDDKGFEFSNIDRKISKFCNGYSKKNSDEYFTKQNCVEYASEKNCDSNKFGNNDFGGDVDHLNLDLIKVEPSPNDYCVDLGLGLGAMVEL